MGSGLSANYENITPSFTLAYWKIHNATRKETHDPVSLWLLDVDKIKSDSSNKKERNTYIESCLYSLKTIQQLDHPNILKIYEADEKDFAFSSEPIAFTMEKDFKYSNDEAYYIADQLASIASYLTNDKKFVSFHYYPGSFAFTSKFILKLCLFNYTSLIIGSQNQTVPRYPWQNIPFAPPLNYTAPEYSNKLQTTSATDTFSYGALITSIFIGKQFFNFQNSKEIQRAISTGSFDIPDSIPSDIRGLLQCCFESDPSRRLTFHEITRFPVFMNLLIRILREIDSISKRSPSERFEFYMRLKQNINLFSQRLLQYKILPLLLDDVKFDVRFGSAVFPIIYYIGNKLNNSDFMDIIFNPLGNLLRRMDPPEYGVAVLDGVQVIINHIERNLIFDIVFPILIAGFSSPNSSVEVAAAKNMPYLTSMVSENCITYNIIPKIGQIILDASDPKVIGYLLKTYEISLDKMDNDMFIEGVMPTLFRLWKKIRSPHLAKPYLTIIQKQNGTLMKSISLIVPLICEMLKIEEIDLILQGELCSFVEAQFAELKKERRIPTNNPNPQNISNAQKMNSNLPSQIPNNGSNSNLPNFSKPLQQNQSFESGSNVQRNNGQQGNNSFFDTSSSVLSSQIISNSVSLPTDGLNLNNSASFVNEFIVQTDQASNVNSFDISYNRDDNINRNNSNNSITNINPQNSNSTANIPLTSNIKTNNDNTLYANNNNDSNNNINIHSSNISASNSNALPENVNNTSNNNINIKNDNENNNNLNIYHNNSTSSFNIFSEDSNSSNNNDNTNNINNSFSFLSGSNSNFNIANTNPNNNININENFYNSSNNPPNNNNGNNVFPTYEQSIISSESNNNNNDNAEAIKESVDEFSFF